MNTLFGQYLDELKVNKTKIADISGIKRKRVSDLSNKEKSIPTPIEFYKIIFTAILLKNLPEKEFNNAINKIFPTRPKVDFLKEFDDLSPDIQFIQKHCLTQKKVENAIKMSDGKISRLGSKDVKEVEAVEFICFVEGLQLNAIEVFKELFGEIDIEGPIKTEDDGNS